MIVLKNFDHISVSSFMVTKTSILFLQKGYRKVVFNDLFESYPENVLVRLEKFFTEYLTCPPRSKSQLL